MSSTIPLHLYIPDDQRHLQAALKMIRKRGALTLRTYHVLMHGLPAAGKTCCKMRLTGQKLTGRKRAERRGNQVWYPDDDSCRSTGVAENISKARVPATIALPTTSARDPTASTAIIHGVDDVPWLMLESFDEEVVDVIKKMGEAIEKNEKNGEDMESLRMEEANLPGRMEGSQPTATPVKAVVSATVRALPPATVRALPEAAPKTLERMITTAFKRAKQEDIQKVLQKETLVYLIDSGGQPQFQELLPILVSGPTLFLLTFSLLEGLEAEFKVRYSSAEGTRDAYPVKRKVLDVLIDSLGSIKCTCSYQARGGERVEVKPRVIFVGTMRGLVTDAELNAIDQQLQIAIKDFMDLVVVNGARVIFPVDSFAEGDGGFADLRKAIRVASSEKVTKMVGGEALTEEVCKVTLPSTSVALELILRSRKKKLITLDECKALAAECGIELTELPAVLWLLQHFIGSIRHYSENPDLREYIVNSPQALYDAPTQLLAETFAFKIGGDLHHVDKKKVWTRGVFTMATLRKLWNDEEFTPDLLLSFLLHLNIVAPLQEKDTYFMPCALVCAPEDGSSDTRVNLRKDSALICFEGGLTPKGVYSSLLAYLLNKKPQTESSDIEWILPTAVGSLSSNRAKLSILANNKFPFYVELAIHLKFIEVAVDHADHAKAITPTQRYRYCHAILRCVFGAVEEVVKHLHYNSNATPKEGLFFPCYCREQLGPHAALYIEKNQLGWCCGRFPKPAEVWIDKWIAVESEDYSTLPAGTLVPTSQPHTSGGDSEPAGTQTGRETLLVCEGEAVSQSAREQEKGPSPLGSLPSATASGISVGSSTALTIDDLFEVKMSLTNLVDWQSLGLALGLLYPTLEMIEKEKRGDIRECKMKMLAAWLQQQDNVSQKGIPSWSVLRTALRRIGENQLANKI